MNNFFLIVLDGLGIGELPDADAYGDTGSNTLVNLSLAVGGLHLPALEKLGLGNIENILGIKKVSDPLASYGKMQEVSKGKDSTTGHWELGGIYIDFDFTYFHDGFPPEIIKDFLIKTGFGGILGNKAASGTEIILELGDEHMRTGYPIIYTSADSVFQIAAHEEVIPVERLYEVCLITREEVLKPPLKIGRVIARPFLGTSGSYSRTTNRKDFSLDPPSDTILDILFNNGIDTYAVGKINDLFNYRGIKFREKTRSNEEGIKRILELASLVKNSFIFANLVDFDVYFGHRNDPAGFAEALKQFDAYLNRLLNIIDDSDVLVITSDHGNDPTTPSTDHSREYVPLLFLQPGEPARDLGIRSTFSDAAKTAADYFNIENSLAGKSFLKI
jgi:phosphopentomutase